MCLNSFRAITLDLEYVPYPLVRSRLHRRISPARPFCVLEDRPVAFRRVLRASAPEHDFAEGDHRSPLHR